MPLIEGFRIQNYRALRDVTLGKVSHSDSAEPLTPLTAVIGKNGVGKSTLFDALGFLADCMASDVETACHAKQRGGFERLLSKGSDGEICFEISYREDPISDPLSYSLRIGLLGQIPVVREERLERALYDSTQPEFELLHLTMGRGFVLIGEGAHPQHQEVALAAPNQLGIAVLGAFKDRPHISRFRDFIKGWYLSYFHHEAARGKPMSGPQRHLNERGDNISNVVQYMQREHPARFQSVLKKIAAKIPGIDSIDTKETEDKRLLLRFNDGAFSDPFLSDQMSDGTLKLFTYLLLLEDPEPPPFLCIEEPENGLYHKLLDTLATELRAHATGQASAPQVFVTTHQPYLVDALTPKEVWILEKGKDGFSTVTRASDIELVRNLSDEGMPLGGLWYSDYLDAR